MDDAHGATKHEPEIVLEVGAEGGSFTIYRQVTPDGVVFATSLNQVAAIDMLDEGDRAGLIGVSRSAPLTSVEEALAILDRTPEWILLHPVAVHDEYADQVVAAVAERFDRFDRRPWRPREEVLRRWRRASQLRDA